MRKTGVQLRLFLLLVAIVGSVSTAAAQAPQTGPAREAADAYLAFARVVAQATNLEEVLPFLSREARQMFAEPPTGEEAAELLSMIQFLMPREIVIVGAKVQETNVELTATGTSHGARANGTILMVREEEGWRVGRERWQSHQTLH
jgi:hypothetical protein